MRPVVVIEPPGNRDDNLRSFSDDLICDMDCTVHLDVLFCVRVRVGCDDGAVLRVCYDLCPMWMCAASA